MKEKLNSPLRWRHIIAVEFEGEFPVDMLRYDHCMPFRESDSRVIENSLRTYTGPNKQRVLVMKFTEDAKPVKLWWTDRWDSFHCKLDEPTDDEVYRGVT